MPALHDALVRLEVTMHASGFSLQTHLQRAPPLPNCLHNSGDFLQKTDVGPTETVSLVVRVRVEWGGVGACVGGPLILESLYFQNSICSLSD